MNESMILEKSPDQLELGNVIAVCTGENMYEFAIFLSYDASLNCVTCFDLITGKNINVSDYTDYLYIDLENIADSKEYLNFLKRDN